MSNPTLTGQDEARRALADDLERCCPKAATASLNDQALGQYVRAFLPTILAALRAPSQDRGAEEMRERAAQAVAYRGERARLALRGGCDGEGYNRAISDTCVALARSIRALPVPTDQSALAQQPKAHGGGDEHR